MPHFIEDGLEETIPVLTKAQRLRILSNGEVRAIVKKRRDHEYSIFRKTSTRKNFLKYAVFEKDLHNLLEDRVSELPKASSDSHYVLSFSASRVNFVYSRAVHRFPSDAKLWLHYARHCIAMERLDAAARVFSRALALCGSDERLWLAAMAYHFDSCSDSRGARVVAQRGLRTLPTSVNMWLEYFRMELFYMARLTTRRYAMGVPPEQAAQQEPEVADDAMHLDNEALQVEVPSTGVQDKSSKAAQKKARAIAKENDLIVRNAAFWNGASAIAVLKGACQKAQLTETHRTQFYKIASECPLVPAPFLEGLTNLFQEHFPACVVVRMLVARMPWDMAKALHDREVALKRVGKAAGNNGLDEDDNRHKLQLSESGLLLVNQLKELLEEDTDWKVNEHIKAALMLSVQNLELGMRQVSEENALVTAFRELKSLIGAKELDPEVTSSELEANLHYSPNGTMRDKKNWDLKALEQYFSRYDAKASVQFDEVRNAVKAQCLVPFRGAAEDRLLCKYLSKEMDIFQLLENCSLLLSLPPVTMPSLCAYVEAFMRLFKGMKHGNLLDCKETCLQIRKVLVKGCSLPDTNKEVRFWLLYVDFERRISKDSKEAAAVNAKAMRVLDPLFHENFVEMQTLQNLS